MLVHRENDLLREQLKRYVEMVQGGLSPVCPSAHTWLAPPLITGSPSPSSQEKEQLAPVEKLSQVAL